MSQYSMQSRPKVPMFVIAILVTLGIVVALLALKLYQLNESNTEYAEEIVFVEDQKVKLENELNQMIFTYDSLKTDNDSINKQLDAQKQYIKKLMKAQASNVVKIRKYQEELGTLRKIMRSYVVQIDSLNTKNKELTAENIQLGEKLTKVETDYEELTKEKEDLSSKVELAKKLSAKDIMAEGLKSRTGKEGKPVDKSDKLDKIRVCFTIRENTVADAGDKTVYVRILRPDDVVLSSDDAGMFEFDEEMIAYSAKRDVEYDNADIDMCIFWNKDEDIVAGTYFITLYAEGYEIGNTTLTLR
ncbi:MAG: hypothetical protein MI922_29055 [Bacteroidales bacterium]|nr:hypothetical protein [Bacteroidales bacterium]